MKTQNRQFMILMALTFVISACAGGASTNVMEKPEDAMMEKSTEEAMMDKPTAEAMMPHETPISDAMAKPAEETMMDLPAWYSVSLTDVSTGETFTINALKGKVVLVETMAVWCSNCFKQQTQVKALHDLLGERDDFVSLGIDIDPNEEAEKLKSFTGSNGFDWLYVVSPADVARDIASVYGNQFLNPPSTPMLIIDRHGEAHPLPFGIKSAEDLLNALQPFLDEAM